MQAKHLFTGALLALAVGGAAAQQASYGHSINLEAARKLAAAAEVEAHKLNISVAISIVDTHGFPVFFEVLDDTQSASVNIAVQKARTAAMLRRPTKALEDGVGGGRNALLSLPDTILIEGGEPIIVNGKVIGAIGISGGSSAQDGTIARGALAATK
ncbi:MAG: heme-binding protein [Pseudomonadota bacterium]